MRHSLHLVCTAALFFAAHTPAHADTFDLFTFNAPSVGISGTATIAASPTPDSFSPGVSFTLNTVNATVEGVPFTGQVSFLSAGGVNGDGTILGGDTLFTGLTSAPTFRLGNFTLSGDVDLGFGAGPQLLTGTVNISQIGATPAVPEPATFALVGTSALGLLGFVRRRLA